MSEPLKPQQDPLATEPSTDKKEAKPQQPPSDDERLSTDGTTHPSIKNK